jgi:hypothetical protein
MSSELGEGISEAEFDAFVQDLFDRPSPKHYYIEDTPATRQLLRDVESYNRTGILPSYVPQPPREDYDDDEQQ